MDHMCNYKVRLKTLDHASSAFKRYIHEEDNLVYVYSYKKVLNKIQVAIKNINGISGEEFTETFEIPYKDVKSIEEINYKTTYIPVKKNLGDEE